MRGGEYTAREVRSLLQRYHEIRAYLHVAATLYGEETQQTAVVPVAPSRRPLGWTYTGQPWPFMSKPHAVPPYDGKAKARARQELHVVLIDLQGALASLPSADAAFLLDYYASGYTHSELSPDSTQQAVSARAIRLVRKVTNVMNEWCKKVEA